MSQYSSQELLLKMSSIEERLNQLDAESNQIQTKQIDTLIKNAQWCLKVLKDENIQIRDLKTLSRRFVAGVSTLRDDISTFVGLAGLRANSTKNEQYSIACECMNNGDIIGAATCINGCGVSSVHDTDLIAAMDSIMRSLRRVENILPTFMLSELKVISEKTGLIQIEHDPESGLVTKFNVAKKIGHEEISTLEKQIALILNENAINLLQEEVERISTSLHEEKSPFVSQAVESPGFFEKSVGENHPEHTNTVAPKR